MPMLSELLDLPPRSLISLVGAGGKTTTMYTLASELAQRGSRIITTTTTNIYFPKQGETDTLIVAAGTPALLKMISAAWEQHQRVTVAGKAIDADKIGGLQLDQPYELLMKSGADVVIVEADGARHGMIKAPAEHEPAVPPQTNVALLMMSAEAINQPLSGSIAHRPERVAAVLGINQGDVLTAVLVAKLMMSEQGGMKNIPEMAEVYVLITHVTEERWDGVREVAELVRRLPRAANVYCSNQPGAWFVM
ncbi:MAG: selenium cofactor biosynthesis protein YqeC [Ktedonobacteraceae bacterium]